MALEAEEAVDHVTMHGADAVKQNGRERLYCGTVQNSTEDIYLEFTNPDLLKDHVKYVAVVQDIAPTTGTHHLHVAVRCDVSVRQAYVAVRFPHVDHWERCVDWARYLDYMKPSVVNSKYDFFEMGTSSARQETQDRKDELAQEFVRDGAESFAKEFPGYYVSHHRGLHQLQMTLMPAMKIPNVRFIYVFGGPGVGKSTFCSSGYGMRGLTPEDIIFKWNERFQGWASNIFEVPYPDMKWFDGYDPAVDQIVVLNDAADRAFGGFQQLLLFSGSDKCTVPIKGGRAPLLATVRFMNCTKSPGEYMAAQSAWEQHKASQFYRRCTNVIRLERDEDDAKVIRIVDVTNDPNEVWGNEPTRRADLHIRFPPWVLLEDLLPRVRQIPGIKSLRAGLGESAPFFGGRRGIGIGSSSSSSSVVSSSSSSSSSSTSSSSDPVGDEYGSNSDDRRSLERMEEEYNQYGYRVPLRVGRGLNQEDIDYMEAMDRSREEWNEQGDADADSEIEKEKEKEKERE